MAHTASAPMNPSAFWAAAAAPTSTFRSTAHLDLQHFLCQSTAGHHLLGPRLLRPARPHEEDSGPLRIADLGCGNGAWLCDLHDQFLETGAPGVQLDGYDLDPSRFPAPEFLPAAVRLRPLDPRKPPEPALEGVYDVVHLRAFAGARPRTDAAPLLSTVLALLKPGGYLQWEEARADDLVVEAPATGAPSDACRAIARLFKANQQHTHHQHGPDCARLDQLVLDHGFDDVLLKAFSGRRPDGRAWTADFLRAWEGLADLFPPRARAPFAPVTRESFWALFRRAVGETERGVAVRVGEITVAVGRKPL